MHIQGGSHGQRENSRNRQRTGRYPGRISPQRSRSCATRCTPHQLTCDRSHVRKRRLAPVLLTARRRRYQPARYMKGPPQAHPRPVRGRRKLARHRPAESTFIRGRSLHSAGHAQTGQDWPAARRGQSKAIPRYQQRSRDCPGIPRAMRRPDSRPASDLPGAWRVLHRGRHATEIQEPAVR